MKELVVISGKGGTGKTSIVAAFASLAKNAVLVDCDVDAADLHIILQPDVEHREEFSGGKLASIRQNDCTNCGKCFELCRYDAIKKSTSPDGKRTIYEIDRIGCEGCGVCAWFCPEKAIDFDEAINGEWFISNTRFGKLVHARLGIAEENSGKLVSVVRTAARKVASENDNELIIIDGSPGIGCPVIASISGAKYVLIVTEPTLSAIHDMGRVIQLTKHFNIPTGVCINKWDLNSEISNTIEKNPDIKILGKTSYNTVFTKAQIMRQTVIEYSSNGLVDEIKILWENVLSEIG